MAATRAMPTDLILICHGPTPATRRAAFPADEPLEPGAQARIRALRLPVRRTAQVWTSPALRARQTAEALRLAASPESALAECDYGRWAGRTPAEVGEAEPEGFAAWLKDPAAAPHGGESLVALLARVSVWLEAGLAAGGHGAAVTHASVVRAALVHVLGTPMAAFWRADVAPLGFVRLRSDGLRWTLRLDPPS